MIYQHFADFMVNVGKYTSPMDCLGIIWGKSLAWHQSCPARFLRKLIALPAAKGYPFCLGPKGVISDTGLLMPGILHKLRSSLSHYL